MHFAFTSDQRDFAAALRALLGNEFPASALRAVWDSGTGFSPVLWRALGDMGVLGAMVPEADGGLGMQPIDIVLLFIEMGRAAVPGPVIEHIAVGGPAVAGTSFAAGVADGSTVITTALEGSPYVAHSAWSTAILESGGVRTGWSSEPVASIDGGRLLAVVSGGTGESFSFDVSAARLRGALASAAYLVGLSEHMISIAAQYARVREQFGKPIGSFQAVKHLMADALLKVEFAKPALYKAAWGLSQSGAGAVEIGGGNTPRAAAVDVSMAKALASEAAYRTSRSAMQVHGAIGYTWEADLQLFMKKAWALQRAWGDAPSHRRIVRQHLLGV